MIDELPIIQSDVLQEFTSIFGEVRIVDLLFYGSRMTINNYNKFSDFDYYLILDKPQDEDMVKLRNLIAENPLFDITLQYKSILESRGLENFQHGNHGIFFFLYLATAKSLLGENYFAKSLETIDLEKEKSSLLFQIEEYFWRLNRQYLYEQEIIWVPFFKKYIIRICIDMLLYSRIMPYDQVSTLSRAEVITNYIIPSNIFSENTKTLISKQYQSSDSQYWIELKESLYQDYLDLFVLHQSKTQAKRL